MALPGIEEAFKVLKVTKEDFEAEAKDTFAVYDSNKSGAISIKELEKCLSDIAGEKVETWLLKKVFKGLDVDGNGKISRDEFYVLVAKAYVEEGKKAAKL